MDRVPLWESDPSSAREDPVHTRHHSDRETKSPSTLRSPDLSSLYRLGPLRSYDYRREWTSGGIPVTCRTGTGDQSGGGFTF